jgi:hypothetical protein
VRCFSGLALVTTLALGTSRAPAEEGALPLELDWRAPADCYTAEMIRAELGRIARVRPGRVPAKLSASGQIDKQNNQYRLSLRTEQNGQLGERVLVSSECRSLGREVTLVLALAFGEGVELVPDEERGARPAPASERSTGSDDRRRAVRPDTARKPASAAPSNAPSAPRLPSPQTARRTLFAGGGVLFEALPGAAAYAFAGAELGTRGLWLAPRLSLLPRVNDDLARNVDARYDGLGAALAACAGTSVGATNLAACATGSATAVRGRSWGASESGSAVAPWYAAGANGSLTWPDDSLLSVRLEAALQVSLNQPRFVIEGLGEVHVIPRLAPSIGLSVVVWPARRSLD